MPDALSPSLDDLAARNQMTHQAPPPNPVGPLYSSLTQLARNAWGQAPDLAPIPPPSGDPNNLINDLLRYPEYLDANIAQAMPFASWGGVTLKKMPFPGGAKKTGDYYHLLDDAGRAVANMHIGYHPELKEAYVSGLYGERGSGTTRNTLGPAEIRSLVQEIGRLYPEAEGVNALRVSGARGQAAETAAARGVPRSERPSMRARISLRPGAPEKNLDVFQFLDLMATTDPID